MSDKAPQMNQVLEFIVEQLNLGIVLLDQDHTILRWNRFMAIHSGCPAEEVVGQNLFQAFPDLPQRWLEKKIRSVFILKNFAFTSWQQRPYLFKFRHNRPMTSDMDYMRQDCTLIPIAGEDNEVAYVCLAVQDVTENSIYQGRLREALRKMQEMSVTDGLTGLYNRRHLETALATEFERARRHEHPLSVLMFDIDHFKQVNDTHGHRAGDEVLKAVAGRITAMLRKPDICARYGGEEFTLVLPDTYMAGALQVAERIRQAMADETVTVDNVSIDISVTIGVATRRANMTNHEALLDMADDALYRGKEAGRNQVVQAESNLGNL